jgi:DNA polymerase
MIIGEAPGANEDLEGRAFVGRGGRLLDQLMSEIGVDTNKDALIVNVLKCRPPGNRPPTPEEARNCRPYFSYQLKTVRPRYVLLMGATAAKHLFPDDAKRPMRERVGRFAEHPEFPGTSFMVTFHPAYLLRDPRQVPEAKKHLGSLRAAMR